MIFSIEIKVFKKFWAVYNAKKHTSQFFWYASTLNPIFYYCRPVTSLKCIIHGFLLTGRHYSAIKCTCKSRHLLCCLFSLQLLGLPLSAVFMGRPWILSYKRSWSFRLVLRMVAFAIWVRCRVMCRACMCTLRVELDNFDYLIKLLKI